ncbi:MAG: NAD-binding protein, partial [Verrucomicrobiota bacterium]
MSKNNIDPNLLADAFKLNASCSPLVEMKIPTMAEGNFDPHFALRNSFKDAQFGLTMGTDANVDLPVLSTVAAAMFNAMRNGHEEEDFSAILTNYQKASTPHPASSPPPNTPPTPKKEEPATEDPLDSILAPPTEPEPTPPA